MKRSRKLLTVMAICGLAAALAYTAAEPPAATSPAASATQAATTQAAAEWPCWRGPTGESTSADIPAELPQGATPLWEKPLSGLAYSGVVAAGGKVIVYDHQKDKKDIVRCFDAETGEPAWTHEYENTGEEMDWGSCPRSTPVIHGGSVFVLSARGVLKALSMDKGKVLWSKDLVKDFRAEAPMWGWSSSLLVADGKLIVNPGTGRRSIVAMDLKSGETLWEGAGGAANYGSFTTVKVGQKQVLVSYDQENLTGRDLADGKVLWSMPIDMSSGYLVPSPAVWKGKVLQCSGLGAQLLDLGKTGELDEDAWEAGNEDFQLDNSSPVVWDDMALGIVGGKGVVALDLRNGLKTLWSTGEKGMSTDFGTILCGQGRAMLLDSGGKLHLFEISREGAKKLGSLVVCKRTMAAPALVGSRLFVRDEKSIRCIDLEK